MFCRVSECKFPDTHTTSGHRCGRCYSYGHGMIECRNETRKMALQTYASDEMPQTLRCPVPTCAFAWSHSLVAHSCRFCRIRGGNSECVHCCVPTGEPAPPSLPPTSSLAQRPVACPVCRVESTSPSQIVYTGGECVVCMTPSPCVLFEECKHAVVCATCVEKL